MGLPLMEDQVRLGCHQINETRIHGRDMTPEQLVQIKAALSTVTPGSWFWSWGESLKGEDGQECYGVIAPNRNPVAVTGRMLHHYEDAAFIAGARTWVPDLVAEVERLTAENDRLAGMVGHLLGMVGDDDRPGTPAEKREAGRDFLRQIFDETEATS
jgi:hypothetical protein